MQKINLLPADLAPTGLSGEVILFIRKSTIGLGALILLFFLLGTALRFEFTRESKILAKMMGKVKESDLLAENIEDLKKRQAALKQELADINGYLSAGLVWSKKLKQLSALMPEEVGLSRISFVRKGAGIGEMQEKEVLNLKGSLIPLEGIAPINTLSAFVNKLKADKEFFPDFDDLLISEVRKFEKSDIEAIGYKDAEDLLTDKLTSVEKIKADVMAFEISLVIKK
ncbi:MAG: hypothetical protein AABY43_01055 [Candidatus Omnitrophota bacterium]